MRRMARYGAVILALAAAATAAFLWRIDDAATPIPTTFALPAPPVAADPTPAAPAGAIGRVAVVPFVEPESRPADSRPSDSRPAPESLPTTGVRGRITSPRFRLNPESDPEPVFGVDPARIALYPGLIDASVRGNVITRPGAPARVRSSAGDFVMALTPGLWCIAARHEGAPDGTTEFWNAHVKVREGELVDLGAVQFGEAVTRGRVVDANGAGLVGQSLMLDDLRDGVVDGRNLPLLSIVQGVTDKDGWFYCAFSRYSGPSAADRSGPAIELRWMALAGRRPVVRNVLNGSATEIVLNLDAAPDTPIPMVAFSVGIKPGQAVSVFGNDVAYDVDYPADQAEPDGRRTFSLGLQPGSYVVECRDGVNVSRERIEVAGAVEREAPLRIEPRWSPGRTVYGDFRGRVARILPLSLGPIVETAAVAADGPFELSGLPTEEFVLKVGDRTVTVPAGQDGRVRLPE